MNLGQAFVYITSSIMMFFAGSMPNWLVPWMEKNGIPDWITKSFSLLAIIFVFATLLNMWFVGKFTPKEPNEIKESEKNKIIKKEEAKYNKQRKALIGEHKRELKEIVLKECDSVKKELESTISRLEEDNSNKQVTIDVLSTELSKSRQVQNNPGKANVKTTPPVRASYSPTSASDLGRIFPNLKDSK